MSDLNPRTLLRQAIVDRLKTSKVEEGAEIFATPAGARVFPGRALPSHVDILPAALVYDDKERNAGEYYQDLEKRIVTLTVECQASANTAEDLDLILDALDWAVQRVVLSDPTHGGLAQDTSYSNSEKDRDADGAGFFGTVWVDFEIDYPMPSLKAVGSIDDFLIFHASYDLVPPDGAIDAVDEIHLPAAEEG
jgi:hypothetical protein